MRYEEYAVKASGGFAPETEAAEGLGNSVRLLWLTALCFLYLIHTFVLALSPDAGVSEVFFGFSGEARILAANLFMMACASTGMVLFGLAHHGVSPEASRRRLLGVFAANGAARLVMALYPGTGVYTAALFVFMLTWGFAATLVHYRVSRQIAGDGLGRFVGYAMALQALLLGGTTYLDKVMAARSVSLVMAGLSFAAFLWFAVRGTEDEPETVVLRPLRPDAEVQARLPQLALGVAVLSLLHGLSDQIAYHSMPLYEPLFWLTRLSYAVGLVAAGWLADRYRPYLPLIALFARSSVLIYRYGSSDETLYPFLLLADEFLSAFIIVFVMLVFLDLATRAERPALWAGMGRVIEMPLASIGAAVGGLLWSYLPIFLALYVALIFSAFFLLYRALLLRLDEAALSPSPFLVFAEAPRPAKNAEPPAESVAERRAEDAMTESVTERRDEDAPLEIVSAPTAENRLDGTAGDGMTEAALVQQVSEQMPEDSSVEPVPEETTETVPDEILPEVSDAPVPLEDEATSDDHVDALCAQYGFTVREREVLEAVLAGRSLRQIADELGVRIRTARYHYYNLMAKTGASSTQELLLLLARKS